MATPRPGACCRNVCRQVELVLGTVCRHFDLSLETLLGRDRSWNIAWPRFLCMYLLAKQTSLAKDSIASIFDRQHGACHHALQAVEDCVTTDARCRAQLEALERELAAARRVG
jgi:chromosomal replication initiator protein